MLNRTQKESAKKIKSALSNKSYFILYGVVILISLLTATIFLSKKSSEPYVIEPVSSCGGLQLDSGCINLEKVITSEDQALGLSGRQDLADDSAMLFVFDEPATRCFWMKDMQFSLDIIWLNSKKQISKIEKDVDPKTYPKEFCQEDAQFVLEFHSGFAVNNGLKLGSELKF